MARGVNISIGANASGVVREAKKVEGALDDMVTGLQDVTRESGITERETSADLKDIADEADKQADRLEKSFRDAFEDVRKKADTEGDKIGKNLSDGAEDGLNDFKSEAASTGREAAASFSGEFSDVTDTVQEIAANAFAGLGPAGAAAGLVAAAGIGVVTSRMEEAKEEAQDTAEAVADVAGELLGLETGGSARGIEQLTARIEEMATAAEDGSVEFNDLKESAQNAGIGWEDFIRGVAGDSASATRSLAEIDRHLDPINAKMQEVSERDVYTDAQQNAQSAQIRALQREARTWQDLRSKITDANGILDDGTQLYHDATAAIDGLTESTSAVATATDTAKQNAEDYAAALSASAEPAGLYADAMDKAKTAAENAAKAAGKTPEQIAQAGEDATVTLQGLLDELALKVSERQDFEANLKDLADRGFGALAAELRAGGPEANAATTALLAAGTDAQVQQYARNQGSLTGQNLVQGAAGGITSKQIELETALTNAVTGFPIPSLVVPVKADTTSFRTTMDALLGKTYTVTVNGRSNGTEYF